MSGWREYVGIVAFCVVLLATAGAIALAVSPSFGLGWLTGLVMAILLVILIIRD